MNDIQFNRNTINITVGDAMEWRRMNAIAHSSISNMSGRNQTRDIAFSELELCFLPETAISAVSKTRDVVLAGFLSQKGIDLYSAECKGVVTPACSGDGNPSWMESLHPAIVGGNIYKKCCWIKTSTADLPGWYYLQVVSATNRHGAMLVVQ